MMSLHLVEPLITKGYGLADEDFDEIIRMEKLKDISQNFAESIDKIQENFHCKAGIRVVEFDELSGVDSSSSSDYNKVIREGPHIFYHPINSNKNCCIVFYYTGVAEKRKAVFKNRILPHEFAHHYQFAFGDFPYMLGKGLPENLFPQFAKSNYIGPESGEVYVDNLLVKDCRLFLLKDLSERISDTICEGMLLEKGFCQGILEQYRAGRNIDPRRRFPPSQQSAIRYARRLAFWDVAEWHEILGLVYPKDHDVKSMLSHDRRFAIRLNKEFDGAKNAFKAVYDLCLKTDYNTFKEVKNCIDYMKEIMRFLNIELRIDQIW
jgi:hypothetical protein